MDIHKIAAQAVHDVSDLVAPLPALGGALERLGGSLLGIDREPEVEMPGDSVRQHPRLHAHNDELHKYPLISALRAGSSSVEVDTHLVDGQLLIGHDALSARLEARTLEDTYLKPLKKRVDKYGEVYKNHDAPPFTLEIEFKDSPEESYRSLESLLKKYPKMFTRYEDGKVIEGPVNLVLTGKIPAQARRQNPRLVAFDGSAQKLLDHPEEIDRYFTPRVNGRWSQFFAWDGQGEMSPQDMARLRKIVKNSDDRDVQLRFWDAPDTPEVWQLLSDAGVQLISTDYPGDFARWDRHSQ